MAEPANDQTAMYELLKRHFSLEELKELCVYLGVDFDDLGGSGKSAKARELVLYLGRHGRLPELEPMVRRLRPELFASNRNSIVRQGSVGAEEDSAAVNAESSGESALVESESADLTALPASEPVGVQPRAGLTLAFPPVDITIPYILRAGKPLEFEWCWIPAGPFVMGSNQKEDEGPSHEINLDGFWIARYPVTNAQFRLFLQAGGYGERRYWSAEGWHWTLNNGISQPEFWNYDKWNQETQPVVGVSWYETEAFCRWAASIAGEGIRLPNEEEWEKAARGRDRRKYPWRKQEASKSLANFGHNIGKTTPVGEYSPDGDSPYGCADMAGNVWEWTDSWYLAYPGTRATSDGFGETCRVIRGGSWHDDATYIRTSNRGRLDPERRFDFLGFRCAATPSLAPDQPVTAESQDRNNRDYQVHLPRHDEKPDESAGLTSLGPAMALPPKDERFLSSTEREWLAKAMGGLARFKSYDGRENLLIASEIPDEWIGVMTLDGGPLKVARTVINDLERRGSLPKRPKKHALGSLLETLANEDFGYENQVRAAALVIRYQLDKERQTLDRLSERFGVPLPAGAADMYERPWQAPRDTLPAGLRAADLERKLEALHHQGRANWLDVEFLEGGAHAARAVCRLEWGKQGEGTGFLIAPDLILTNYHVINPPPGNLSAERVRQRLANCEVRFGVTGGERSGTRVVGLDEEVGHSKALDYALLRLREAVEDGERIRTASLSREKIALDQAANIIQHPLRGAMKVALRNNQIVDVRPQRVYYLSDTEAGSSGSPVFDDRWQVIALHRAGGLQDETGRLILAANEGVPILDIWPEIEAHI